MVLHGLVGEQTRTHVIYCVHPGKGALLQSIQTLTLAVESMHIETAPTTNMLKSSAGLEVCPYHRVSAYFNGESPLFTRWSLGIFLLKRTCHPRCRTRS